ncbi:cobalt-precorrin-7 (C(5))-methyltransferase [Methanococcoides alaskense]|uniref:Cobalt-precorrin-7 (C5)-methyltransferase n=1 Tax=Methanococcoides alaskense TaxID=325778 RepID=A0AA90Z908_9EURY|nr:cobalt-precorrin-7 (C(5))-methyltransferase [Methanococcoides alaskense]MDA0524763.1 cobalt-precorrin-7 (C(5))-methyltransferase [Methanococcoides alaskense]MDR6223116.1 cobalt-precorrin-7 (C5)-methyltransferase [Methanococcoides alaskense]
MIIAGVGVGPNMLTLEAIEAIRNASVVYGSKRSLELAEPYIEGEAHLIKDYKALHELPEDAVVLSTGDPMFSGLGKFARESDRIIPGISSIQVACSRLGVSLSNITAITAHGRDPSPAKKAFVQEIELGKDIFMLPADTFGVAEIAEVLKEMGVDARIYVCENFGYPEERIAGGTVDEPPEAMSVLHCVVVVR